MKKRLCSVGNSLALIIDKPTRRMLDLGPLSIVEVWTDGRRLVMEATGETLDESEVRGVAPSRLDTLGEMAKKARDAEERSMFSRRALDLDADSIFRELQRRGLTRERLAELSHEPPGRFSFGHGWIGRGKPATHASSDELATLRRMRVCRDRLRAGGSWEDAITVALATFPKHAPPVAAQTADAFVARSATASVALGPEPGHHGP